MSKRLFPALVRVAVVLVLATILTAVGCSSGSSAPAPTGQVSISVVSS